jgi:hypothetical protein
MWYHAVAYYGTRKRTWWNRNRDDFIDEVVVPFVAKQVRAVSRLGVTSLFNFGAAEYITIIKTSEKLKGSSKGKTPIEFSDIEFLKKHEATAEFIEEMQVLAASGPSRSLIQRALEKPENMIFVVMKFGDQVVDSAFEGVIKPLGEEFGYRVVRVDELQDSGNISQQILEHISRSRLVIADLTGERPNCYYEAGFAHALGKEMIFSINSKSPIHFDLAAYRFITWATEAEYRKKLRARFESIAEKRSA